MSISPEKREVLAAAAQAAAEATIKKWFKMPENDKDIIRQKWKTINFITEIKIMKMNDDFIFTATGERIEKTQTSKSANPLLQDKVLELKSQGLSYRKIEDVLKETDLKIGKSAIAEIINKASKTK